MRIAIGCDHKGLGLKQSIMKMLADLGHEHYDFGCFTSESVDYPDIAKQVAESVASGNFERGILICNTGIGMSIASNKVKGIRAALCYNAFTAGRARQHNDTNILCLGTLQELDTVREIVEVFMHEKFEGGRHACRVDKIKTLES
ncbi:ribose 5-phosphate isomerase B [Chloroflexota bacterium]